MKHICVQHAFVPNPCCEAWQAPVHAARADEEPDEEELADAESNEGSVGSTEPAAGSFRPVGPVASAGQQVAKLSPVPKHGAVRLVPTAPVAPPPGHTRPRTVCNIISFGVKTCDPETSRIYWAGRKGGYRPVFERSVIIDAVHRAEPNLSVPVMVLDARPFRPKIPVGRNRPVQEFPGHSGWHPGIVASLVLYDAWPSFVQSVREQFPAVLAEGARGRSASIVAYCNAGEIRSVAVARVMHLLLTLLNCRPFSFVSVYHLADSQGHWAKSRDFCRMCSECKQELRESTIVELMFPFLAFWE